MTELMYFLSFIAWMGSWIVAGSFIANPVPGQEFQSYMFAAAGIVLGLIFAKLTCRQWRHRR